MRILHTSDWHLGRHFHGAALLDHQARALDRVVEIAADSGVDAVVIAGDLYDRAIPPADAVDLLAEVLRRLRALGGPVVAITGNHDSPSRVGALDPLLRAGGVTLRGRLDAGAPVVVPATDGGSDLVIHPVPYQEPLAAEAVTEADGHRRRPTQHEVLVRSLDACRVDLVGRGVVRSVAVAHAFVAGAAPSSSERELSVGGVDRVPVSAFDGFTYAALGHLHRPQALSERVAYSGSLLPYSFSETAPSSVRVVDLAADGSVTSEVLALGCERRVATIEGRLATLLSAPSHQAAESAWVKAVLHDEVLPRHAMDRLRDRFPHAVVIEHARTRPLAESADPRRAGEAVTDVDLAAAFVADQFGRPASGEELVKLSAAFDIVNAARAEQLTPVVSSRLAATTADGDDEIPTGEVA